MTESHCSTNQPLQSTPCVPRASVVDDLLALGVDLATATRQRLNAVRQIYPHHTKGEVRGRQMAGWTGYSPDGSDGSGSGELACLLIGTTGARRPFNSVEKPSRTGRIVSCAGVRWRASPLRRMGTRSTGFYGSPGDSCLFARLKRPGRGADRRQFRPCDHSGRAIPRDAQSL